VGEESEKPVELSAVVMCFNERATIGRCLDSLAFCDEVVVVDDMSTDGTWEYLQTRQVKAVQNRHTTFAAQRELGKSLARGRWILTMDADEVVSEELARAIRDEIVRPRAPDGFYLVWKNAYPKSLKGYWYARHPRLVRADKCTWQKTDNPHSPLDLTGVRLGLISRGHVDHEGVRDVPTLLRKLINRNVIMAAQARAQGKRVSGSKLFFSSVARFFKAYFLAGHFRHGVSGLIMSGVWAFEAFSRMAFMREAPQVSPEKLMDGGPGSYPEGAPLVAPGPKG
jgi:glycosyltransferase involved in cell wall biosynthesis